MMNIKNTIWLLLNVNLIYSINQSKVSNSNNRVESKLSQFSRNRLLSKTFLRNNLSSSVLQTIRSFHRFFFIFLCLTIGFICIILNRFRPCSMSISVQYYCLRFTAGCLIQVKYVLAKKIYNYSFKIQRRMNNSKSLENLILYVSILMSTRE